MSETLSLLRSLRRPRLLIRAARFGLSDYRRDTDLPRVLQRPAPNCPEGALQELVVEEQMIEEIRRSGDASYSISHHIELLVAMMSEARLLPTSDVPHPG